MDNEIELTEIEQAAINRLRKLAAKWPQSLLLFSQNGLLLVLKDPNGENTRQLRNQVAEIDGIPNDGGDADY